jgi:hypothetical protein
MLIQNPEYRVLRLIRWRERELTENLSGCSQLDRFRPGPILPSLHRDGYSHWTAENEAFF